MRLLLGSGGFGTPARRAAWTAALAEHLAGVERVLFLPYALAQGSHDRVLAWMREAGFDAGLEHVGLHREPDPVAAVRGAQALSVGGGNTFRLVRALHDLGLVEPLRERVRAGVPYVGVSAGSNVACPTLGTTNDMPIVRPPSHATLGLVPFQINPHYHSGRLWVEGAEGAGGAGGLVEHRGETRDERIAEFHEEYATPVVGLREGAWLAVRDGRVTLHGAGARLFRRGEPARDVEPGEPLEGWLA